MKRFFVAAALLGCTVFNASAQAGKAFSKGDKLVNAGLGLNSYYSNGFPAGVSLEVGVSDLVSVGGNVDYLAANYNYSPGYKYKYTALYFGARASYHFNEILQLNNEKVDLYGGVTLGFRNFSFRDDFSNNGLGNEYSSGLFLGGYLGGRYYFGKSIGAFAELGAIGATNARVGITCKF
ncbi:hypothetical protein [Ferruginibacter profundus]